MSLISLNVNGKEYELDVDPDIPLIFVLRNNLGLIGPKLGCGQEQCGACVVLANGESVNSCVRAASEFEDIKIVTIEGLEKNGELSDVQEAFIQEGAAQCGYCTAGIIIATTALFKKNRSPNRKDVEVALSDHLCRCGSHNRVLAAIDRLKKAQE